MNETTACFLLGAYIEIKLFEGRLINCSYCIETGLVPSVVRKTRPGRVKWCLRVVLGAHTLIPV